MVESTDVPATATWIASIAGFDAPEGRGLSRDDEQVGSLLNGEHDRWLGPVVVDDPQHGHGFSD